MPKKKLNPDITYQEVVDYFKAKGYSEVAAKGIAGNIGQESSFDSQATNAQGMKGYVQWDTNRRGALAKFAGYTKDPYSKENQLAFIEHELNTGYKHVKNKLATAKTATEASDIFQNHYEGAPDQDTERRRYIAENGKFPTGNNWNTGATAKTTIASAGTKPVQQVLKVENVYPKEGPVSKSVVPTFSGTPVGNATGPKVPADIYQSTPKTDTKDTPQFKTRKGSRMADAVPYLSNIYNAFQKPAAIPNPIMDKPIQLQRVRMDNDRYQANSAYRGMNNSIDNSLDASTGALVKMANKAQNFQQVSAVNEKERLANQEIANKELGLNTSISMGNNEKLYQNRLLKAERENTIKSMNSANVSNAADKFIAQQNVNAQYDLEDRKMQMLANSDSTGAYKAYLEEQQKNNPELFKKSAKFGGRLYSAGRMVKLSKPQYR